MGTALAPVRAAICVVSELPTIRNQACHFLTVSTASANARGHAGRAALVQGLRKGTCRLPFSWFNVVAQGTANYFLNVSPKIPANGCPGEAVDRIHYFQA